MNKAIIYLAPLHEGGVVLACSGEVIIREVREDGPFFEQLFDFNAPKLGTIEGFYYWEGYVKCDLVDNEPSWYVNTQRLAICDYAQLAHFLEDIHKENGITNYHPPRR